jgi:hypothetical protein
MQEGIEMRHGSFKRDEFCGNPRVTYTDTEHLPHWKTGGDGWCVVEFVLYKQGLSIDTMEASKTPSGRNGATRRTMETLDDAATRALFQMLKERYEPASVENAA